MPKKIKKKKPYKKRKVNRNVELIKRLVDIPDPAPEFFWKKESMFAKKFFELHGDDLLLLSLDRKLKSLAFLGYIDNLAGRIATCVLQSKYEPAEYEKIELNEKKSGKDAIIKRKPRNLRQWLDQ